MQDSGPGISSQEVEKLFRPFEQVTTGDQAAGGSGLGLAISREYARMLGGDITVVSTVGEGSCFCLDFPAPVSVELPFSADPPRRIIGLAPGQEEIRVLIVDDHDVNRGLLREMLQPLGFVVAEAVDGKEAMEKSLAETPRIIRLDLVMPGMSGGEATRILRSMPGNDSLAIIGITASAFEEARLDFLASGIDACISKPFQQEELLNLLAEHAGVCFESEEPEAATVEQKKPVPTLDNMSLAWREAFQQALGRRNITRVRELANEAQHADAALSAWLLVRAGRYDLEEMKELF